MFPIAITGKRYFEQNGERYFECFCNGKRIFDRGRSDKEMEENAKNACRVIKYTGSTDTDVWKLVNPYLCSLVELPEWNLN